ncbi:carbohydrate ABC transporter permease [Halomicrococcus gelatinilyticus]|uniref:carbohydrate ABC transporter permease n=1 Tax=Halomicrococcus gelatinilyticus TaxID=1702103 RepID=UPI002E10F94E
MDENHAPVDPQSEAASDDERNLLATVLNDLPSLTRTARYGVAIAIAVLWVVPLLGIVMASIRPLSEIVDGWWHVQGMTVTFSNYSEALAFESAPMAQALLNTAIVTVPSVLIVTLLGAMAAYPFSRFDFPLRKTLFFLMIMVMAAPPELVAMGNYNTLREIGLFDTYLGLMLVHVGWGMGWVVMFLRNYLLGLPEELEEAARIDGASRYQIFRTIILPFATPALVSVAVIQFTWVWNSFFFPMVFMRSSDSYLAPQVLPLLKGRLQVDWGLVAAGSVMTMAVPILLFVFLQRYYKRGMIGAVAD